MREINLRAERGQHRGGMTAASPGAMLVSNPIERLAMEPLAPTDKEQLMMRCRRSFILAAVVAAAAFSLLAAGCGGGSPGVANLASSTTTTATAQSGAIAFAACMRSHGILGFPDPNSSGAFDGNALKGVRASQAQMRAAQSHCDRLLPNGVIPTAPGYTITRVDRLDYLKGAACMRRHGFPGFPDPTFQNGNVQLNIPSTIDQASRRFKSAASICQKLVPAGLPYSGTN